MTPLKAASRAYVNAGSEYHGKPNKTIYDAFRDEDQKEADDAMRAALMALADKVENQELKAMLHSMCHADTEQAENQGSASLPSDKSGDNREAEDEMQKPLTAIEQLRLHVNHDLSAPCLVELVDEIDQLQDNLRHLIEEPRSGDEVSQHGDGQHDTYNREAE